MPYIEKLTEINKTELINRKDGYKYVIITYEDITEIQYFEINSNKKMELRNEYTLPSCHDIQICEKIIELRKAFKEI